MLYFAMIAAVPLASTGSWQVNAEPTSCTLSRQYGDASIGFQPLPNGEQVEMVLLATDKALPKGVGSAELDFGAGRTVPWSYWAYDTATGQRIARGMLPRDALGSLAGADSLTVKLPTPLSVRIAGGRKAVDALEACQRQLQTELAIVPKGSGTPARLDGRIAALFGPEAYPKAALKAKEEGKVAATLLIDKIGAVSDCRVLATASAILALQTCAIIRKSVKLHPGTDDQGRPANRTYDLFITWALPSKL